MRKFKEFAAATVLTAARTLVLRVCSFMNDRQAAVETRRKAVEASEATREKTEVKAFLNASAPQSYADEIK
jgi:hypothetical protein